MKKHTLKTINPYFEAAWSGVKTFEVRKNDRDFNVGDRVDLVEYEAESDNFTGRAIRAEITYILEGFDAVKPDYVVFAFAKKAHLAQGEVVKMQAE